MRTGNKYAFNDSYYKRSYRNAVEGSTARELEAEEFEEDVYEDELEEVVEEPVRKTRPGRIHQYRVNTQKSEKIKRKYQINPFASFMLCVSMVVLFISATSYIKQQSNINLLDKQIATAKATLADIEEKNAALINMLDTEVDRNFLYTVAVSQFGMQYPAESQIVSYQIPESGYVKQYGVIPMTR